MRNVVVLIALSLVSPMLSASQACLNVVGYVNGVYCPKCSDPGASARIAGRKISADMCLSCQFYCWYTAAPEGGGEFRFEPIANSAEPGCVPSDAERARVIARAIPVALHVGRADFERLATEDAIAATTLAVMLWRDDDATMMDARHFEAQYRVLPTRRDAMGLFEDYENHLDLIHGESLPEGKSLHVDVNGTRQDGDRVELIVTSSLDDGTRRDVVRSTVIVVHMGSDQVAAQFAGHAVVARHAWATYP